MADSNKIPAAFEGWLAYLDDLLLKGGFYDMAMKSNEGLTCPNCGAVMEKDDSTGIWGCPECHYQENRD